MSKLITSLVSREPATIVVGLERLNANVSITLRDHGFSIVDAQKPIRTRPRNQIPQEVKCIIASLRATEIAVSKLRTAIRPGITANELWSVLHASVIAQNGDYSFTVLVLVLFSCSLAA
jgi:Xaa-Pro aminopeptidase